MTLVTDQGCAGTLHGDVLVPGPAAARSAAAPLSAPHASALSYSALRHLDVHEPVQTVSGDADGSAVSVLALVSCTSLQLHLVKLYGPNQHCEGKHHDDTPHHDTEHYYDRRYHEYERHGDDHHDSYSHCVYHYASTSYNDHDLYSDFACYDTHAYDNHGSLEPSGPHLTPRLSPVKTAARAAQLADAALALAAA